MATASVQKKPCCKCNKGAGVFTCDGCQQSFCRKHTDEHRQELSIQMDSIGQEHDVFQRDLNKEMHPHPLLSRIDEWERESIKKIQQVAKQTRVDLKELIDQNRKVLKTSMNQLTDELQSSRDSEDYTEIDLKRWLNRLKELRNELEKPLALNIIDDEDKRSVIRSIKVSEQPGSRSPNRSVGKSDQIYRDRPQLFAESSERFAETDEKSVLSNDGLMVTCLADNDVNGSTARGILCYSSGTHNITFRIQRKKSKYVFFGIATYDQAKSQLTFAAPSVHGWWELDCHIKGGTLKGKVSTITIQTGDEVTLVLDCDHRAIHFKHHRTCQAVTMPIDLQKCPFPWQILVTLNDAGDCVRILDNNDLF
jgi:hypothetical protein